MARIAITENLAAELETFALQDKRSLEAVVDEALNSYITERHSELPLTPAQIEHLQHGMASADRGEFVSQEEVEAFFDDWEKEASAR
jgi:predicted transcriptional regulator